MYRRWYETSVCNPCQSRIGVEDATAAIYDAGDNLMFRVPLGLAPCLCQQHIACKLVVAHQSCVIKRWHAYVFATVSTKGV